MPRFLVKDTSKHIGEKVRVCGWVNTRRAHGKILFIDLRDISGVMQVVFVPSNKEVYDLAQTLRPEWVVEIVGQIVKRPENMINPKIETGLKNAKGVLESTADVDSKIAVPANQKVLP